MLLPLKGLKQAFSRYPESGIYCAVNNSVQGDRSLRSKLIDTLKGYSGIFLTLLVVGLVHLFSYYGVDIPNPGVLMAVAIVVSAFTAGMAIGFVSVVISLVSSFLYLFESKAGLWSDASRKIQFFVLCLGLPIINILVGILKKQVVESTKHEMSHQVRRKGETSYRQLVEAIKDYGIFKLDPKGAVLSLNEGAQKILGYLPEDIVGKSFEIFYPPEEIAAGKADIELQEAVENGRFEDEGWRVRKDGSKFWANVIVTPLKGLITDELEGFVKITRDLSERKKQEETLRETSIALTAANRELEAFSYSVSHDLRSPLRGIDGFSQALMEDYYDKLDEEGRDYLKRIRSATQRMGKLIDDLLTLSRLGRAEMQIEPVNLSSIAERIVSDLKSSAPDRQVQMTIDKEMFAQGDSGLLTAVLQNLLSNSWKFTAKKEKAVISFGSYTENHEVIYYIKDNGAGFNMAYSDKLFGAFQRLHKAEEFAGTGIGPPCTSVKNRYLRKFLQLKFFRNFNFSTSEMTIRFETCSLTYSPMISVGDFLLTR